MENNFAYAGDTKMAWPIRFKQPIICHTEIHRRRSTVWKGKSLWSRTWTIIREGQDSEHLPPPCGTLIDNAKSAQKWLTIYFKKYFCIKTVLFERQLEVLLPLDWPDRRIGPKIHDRLFYFRLRFFVWYFSLLFLHTFLVHRWGDWNR